MLSIEIKQLSEEEIVKKGIRNWNVWEKEISEFEWYYDSNEECLLLEGEVKIITDHGKYYIKAGDYVAFQAGLKCRWIVKKPVKKYYRFQ